MLINPLSLHQPVNIADALNIKSHHPEARFLAGGTFLINQMKLQKRKGLKSSSHLISLKRIPELHNMSIQDGSINLGSMMTFSDLVGTNLSNTNCAFLSDIARHIGTTQIRNMGTIGGNLCSRYFWTELAAVFLALDAQLVFSVENGKELLLSMADYLSAGTKTDGLLTRIVIKQPSYRLAYFRFSKTPHLDLPLLTVVARAEGKNEKLLNPVIVLNTGTAFAQRAGDTENMLKNQELSSSLLEKTIQDFSPCQYDSKANEYKQNIYKVGLKTALDSLKSKLQQ